jgi:hypothetical protein
MGWFNTLLGLTNVALDVANYSKISQLQQMAGEQQQQAMMSAAAQALINALKQEIFRFRQAAEEILAKEAESPLIAAGGMKILEQNLSESPIKPEYFPDFNDMTYVSNTIKLIRDNASRLMNGLTPREQAIVNDVLQATTTQADYDYYLENWPKLGKYQDAREKVNRLRERNSGPARVIVSIGFYFLSFFVLYFFTNNLGFGTGFLVFIFCFLIGVYGLNKFFDRKSYDQARKTIVALKEEVDLKKLLRIDNLVNGNVDRARKIQQQARLEIENFFAGQFLPAAEPAALSEPSPIQSVPEMAVLVEPISIRPLFCAACGKKAVEGSDFCVWCGERLIL